MTSTAARSPRRLAGAILRVPLFTKLIGANAIILATAIVGLWGPLFRLAPWHQSFDYLLICVILTGIGANIALVWLALKPINELQRVANLVAAGAMDERVETSLLADRHLSTLIDATNLMLERISADRARMRALSAQVIYVQEEERAQVARDLHESVAQILAGASLELTALSRSVTEPNVASKMSEIQALIGSALEEIRAVSQSLHPRVAEDLGLASGLESLARMTRERSLIDVKVNAFVDSEGISGPLSSTLYRLAKEALRSIEQHGIATEASISLMAKGGLIELTVSDDAFLHGQRADRVPLHSLGLQRAKERFSLAGGEVHIDTAPSGGTRVTARISTNREAA